MALSGDMKRVSEDEFDALVSRLAADPTGSAKLTELLHEEHPIYDGRATSAVIRMRGWILLALARSGLSDQTLIFVLEELETGTDPYLVAAAARGLRSYARPTALLAPFVMRALARIRYHDEPISFESYGEYATSSTGTSAVSELLATLVWLGPEARVVLPELERLRAEHTLSRTLRLALDRALQAIRGPSSAAPSCCGGLPDGENVSIRASSAGAPSASVDSILLQDQDAEELKFTEFFRSKPSVVVFFYTRCDNPMKCSLTVTKLARVQELLDARGLARRIRTAAISYDPAFDRAERLRVYGRDRAVRMNEDHKMLRAIVGNDALRAYFNLGVNFGESLVNRHRIELYILDAAGRIVTSFERLHWEEELIVARAVETLKEKQVQ
jgi:protein SCO1/2